MSRPPRLPAFDYTGCHQYFLTFCTHRRQPHFTDSDHVQRAMDQFLYTSREQDVEITTYCFMPDHVHLLATGLTAAADLKAFAARAKQRAGWRFKRLTGRSLWQEGFYDRVLRDDDDPLDVMAYIVNNPLRAKLVARAEDYPHWGSERYTRPEVLEAIQARDGEVWKRRWERCEGCPPSRG